MERIIWIVFPALLLAYYLRTIGPRAKNQPILAGLLIGGTGLYYLGMLFDNNPGVASIIKLSGACLFFSVVAFSTTKKRPPDSPDQTQSNEDSEKRSV